MYMCECRGREVVDSREDKAETYRGSGILSGTRAGQC